MSEKDIFDSLDNLDYNYKTESFNADAFSNALFNDVASVEFTNLVFWLTDELRLCYKLEENVNKVSDVNDFDSFLLELSSFLKELNCPYTILVDAPISQRFSSRENRLQLLNFLCTELQAGRMVLMNAQSAKTPTSPSVQLTESETAASLRLMLMSLGFPKPPPNVTAQQLFAKVSDKVTEQLSKVPSDYLGNPLFIGVLSETQWQTLSKLNEAMNSEYKGREEMLLKRLDVTVQSFSWSDRVKKQEDQLHKVYQPIRKSLRSTITRISFVDLLAGRTDLLYVDKTSGKIVREKTQSKLNKLLMQGKIPDRGGRPAEIEPPPPEMPPWQKRSDGGGHRGGGAPQAPRHGGRGGGGGRVQGQWSSTGGREAVQSWGAPSGGYDQHQHGYAGFQQQGAGGVDRHYGQNAQQGAAYYQDYYSAGSGGGGGYQQQQQGSYQQRGGGRGRGRGGRHHR